MTSLLDERAIWLGRHVLPHEPSLRSWLHSRTPPDIEVDDVIQETYTRLITTARVDQITDPKSYAFQVARSVILTHVRRAKIVSIASVPRLDQLDHMDEDPSPETVTVYRDELARLATAISSLPERARLVFCLRRVHEKTQREIAAQLGITEGAVEKLMGDALYRLRSLLGRERKQPRCASNRSRTKAAGEQGAA